MARMRQGVSCSASASRARSCWSSSHASRIAATAIVALAPAMETFRRGRDFAAWLGFTPRQKSTGGKTKLGRISKMGERTLRRLLNHRCQCRDGLKSYSAAMNNIGDAEKQEVGRHSNNRAENSHLPFRRRDRAMLRFRRMKTQQKFASVHANVHNHFNTKRHLVDRPTYKTLRSAALAEWRGLMA